MVHTQIVAQNTWFSLKILVVEKGATLQENILKEAPCLNKKMALGYGMLTWEFCIRNRILWSPVPNEHPENKDFGFVDSLTRV